MDVIALLCKNCKRELIKGDPICPICDYDNSKSKKTNEIIDVKGKKSVKKNHIPISIIIIILTIICITILFTINLKVNSNNSNNYNNDNTTENIKTNKFYYKDLHMNYPITFKSNKNKLYLKSNEQINIVVETIKKDDYNEYLTTNEYLDSRLNLINTKTYAGDNYYCHIFKFKGKYYKITVNYINNTSSYSQDVQENISKILNSLS